MLQILPAQMYMMNPRWKAVEAVKRKMILGALQAEGGNKVAAARKLGISRSYLHRLINEFGI